MTTSTNSITFPEFQRIFESHWEDIAHLNRAKQYEYRVILLQSIYRARNARGDVQMRRRAKLYAMKNEAAVYLQNLYRGKVAREDLVVS